VDRRGPARTGAAEEMGRPVAHSGVLSGTLEEFRLVELLQALGMGMNTGALHVRRSDGLVGIVYFDNGAIVSATEVDGEALTLGHVLQQLDYANEEQIEQAYDLQTQDPLGKRIGERLIDMGILDEERLTTALRMQILWTVRELGMWRSGNYEFQLGQQLAYGGDIRVDTQDAMMEILRYEHEWEGLQPFLPEGARTNLAMVFEPPFAQQLLFPVPIWRLISRINTHRSVRRIATALHQREVEVARAIGPVVQAGWLTPVDASPDRRRPIEADRMDLRNFDLFSLLIEFEQDRLKRKSPADRLAALAGYINRTMRALEDACQENGLTLAPDTLANLLARENLLAVEDYQLKIDRNRLDVDDFVAFSRRRLDSAGRASSGPARQFYEAAAAILERCLAAAFGAINSRIASPTERAENQTAWEALFTGFRGQPSASG